MDVKNLPGVYKVKEIPEKDFGDYSLKVTNLQISPIRVYLNFDLIFKPGVPMEKIDKIMDTWAFDKMRPWGMKRVRTARSAPTGAAGATHRMIARTPSSSWKRARTMARTKS